MGRVSGMQRGFFLLLAMSVVVALTAAAVFLYGRTPVDDAPLIESFEECAAAGYPVAVSYPLQCRTPDGRMFVEDIGNSLEKEDLIRLTLPRPIDIVTSPLVLEGEARGFWFFEASFPVRLEDEEGTVFAQHYAQAEDEWMTEEFVPFRSEFVFAQPISGRGRLILEKDNPSGLPEHADALVVPVRFGE